MSVATLLLAGLALTAAQGPPSLTGICDNYAAHAQAVNQPRVRPQPRNNKPTAEIIRDNGYECEEHWVTTPDGYILALHRIPHGISNKEQEGPRPVVYVQHGILCSATDWVISTPSKGLGYMLADAGYDVWLGNYRGSTNSRNHTHLNPDSWINHKFWEFTWDEMGKYDIPSMVEKILEVTGHEELFYVGHSMGTTAFMVMAEYRPDILDKVILGNFMAPVSSVKYMGGPLAWISQAGWLIEDITTLLGVGEFLPSNWLVDCIATYFCHEEDITQPICTNVLFLILGYDYSQLNTTLLPDILHHTPAGTSTHTLLHYAQEHTTGGFHAYNWGSKKKNMQHHNSETPPVYDFKKVTTPLAIFWSDNDYFTMPGDILNTIMGLPNVLPGMNHEIEYKQWAHVDFMWGVDADKYIFHQIIKNMQFCRDNDCRNL